MKNRILKIVYWTVGILFVILAFLYFLGSYGYQIQNYFRTQRQEKMLAEGQKRVAEILELQKNDTYGGKTPEETLDLYIEALKAGDIELASKYSEISLENPDLQKKDLDALREIIERDGNLDVILVNMDNIYKSNLRKFSGENKYVITYRYLTQKNATSTMVAGGTEYSWLVPEGTEEEISIVLRLNPYTKVWKIIQ